MTSAPTAISIFCNPSNPVDYLACCGLMDLVSRLDSRTESWWVVQPPVAFHIATDVNETALLSAILHSSTEPSCWSFRTMPGVASDSEGEPVCITVRFSLPNYPPVAIPLDWWHETTGQTGAIDEKSSWKMYAGQQTVRKITTDMIDACRAILKRESSITSLSDLLELKQDMSGRFGWDPRASRGALDVGYSPNDLGLPVSTYPFTELLAMIGIQSFFPPRIALPTSITSSRAWHEIGDDEDAFEYELWTAPLPISLARIASFKQTTSGGRRLRSIRARRKNYSNLTLSQPC